MSWNKSIFCGHNAHLWYWQAAAELQHRPQRKAPRPPENKPCPQAKISPQQAARHPCPAPPWTPLLSDLHWDPLVPLGSRRDLWGAWLLQHILQAGWGLGSSPCFCRSLLWLTRGAGECPVPGCCISPPHLLFTCQLSTLNSSTSPLLTPGKHMVMKCRLCYRPAPQMPAVPVLHAPAASQELLPRQAEQLPSSARGCRAVFRSHTRASSDAVPRSSHQGPSLLCCLQFSLLTIPKNEYILITVFWELGLFSF